MYVWIEQEYITLKVDMIKRGKRIKRKKIKWNKIGKGAKSEGLTRKIGKKRDKQKFL